MPRFQFDYRSRTREQLQRRADQSGTNREGFIKDKFRVWTPRTGDNRIRIMPPTWKAPQHYGIDVCAHYQIGMEGSTFVCLENPPVGYEKEDCPCCIERRRAQEAHEDELAKALKYRKRVCVWMIDRDNETNGPQIWPMPFTIDKDLAAQVIDPQGKGVFEIDNPEAGFDLSFRREGRDERTKYLGVQLGRRETPLSDDAREFEDWMQFIIDNPLPETILVASAAHIAKELSHGGVAERRVREDDDDDRPRRRAREDDDDRPRRRPANGEDRSESRISRRATPRVPADYDALEALDEDEMIALAKSQDIDLDDREPILSQLADALNLIRPRRTRNLTENLREAEPEPEPRRSRREEPEEEPRRARRSPPDDEPEPRRSSRREEPEPERERPRLRSREPEPEPERERPRLRSREPEPEPEEEGGRVIRLRRGLDERRRERD